MGAAVTLTSELDLVRFVMFDALVGTHSKLLWHKCLSPCRV